MLRWIYDQLFKMNYKKIYILLMYVTCYADCEFQVVNYSSEVIKVEAGFHKHNNPIITFEVPKVQTKVALVKSIALCNDIEPSGLGTAYVRLVGGKSKGGFILLKITGLVLLVFLLQEWMGFLVMHLMVILFGYKIITNLKAIFFKL